MQTSPTLNAMLKNANYRPAGFDYLRLILAVCVIIWHSISVCYEETRAFSFLETPFRPLPMFVVPSFFALGGFLVTGSFLRNSVPAFMTLRWLRIFPALCVEVALATMVFGPLLTELPLKDYFTNRKFFSYFLNLVAYIHFELPGVFANLPLPHTVNIQLWTVPNELKCYGALIVLACIGIMRRPWIFAMVIVATSLAMTFKEIFIHTTLTLDQSVPLPLSILCFFFGVLFYLFREQVPHRRSLLIASIMFGWIALTYPPTDYLAALPIAYISVFVGLLNPPRMFLIDGTDYSYGMYIYGFPFQQVLAEVFPRYREWYFNVAGTLVLAGICAYFSWTYVESKALKKKDFVLMQLTAGLAYLKKFPTYGASFARKLRRLSVRQE